jgi:hypothetical protein
MSKTIRVDEEVMARLLETKKEIEARTNRPASMDDALRERLGLATDEERKRVKQAQNLAHEALKRARLL